MKICAAQTRPVRENVEANIEQHKKLINLAVDYGADIIIFPELSITGYEPELAKNLATNENDHRFDDFQKISDTKRIKIGIGMPLRSSAGIQISMIIFQPHQSRLVYAKQYLHADEYPYFVCGNEQIYLSENKNKIALAICYELSVTQHAERAYMNGADIYIASVAKTALGVEKAVIDLSNIACKYKMTVLMSNCIGWCDNAECGGKTSAWNNNGELIGQLSNSKEGLLIIDTDTHEVIEKTT